MKDENKEETGKIKNFLLHGYSKKWTEKYKYELINPLRKLRTELQDLAVMIGKAKSGFVKLSDHQEYLNLTFEQIKTLINEIENMDSECDSVRHLCNIWEQMEHSKVRLINSQPPSGTAGQTTPDPGAYLQFLTLLEGQIREMVLYIGYKTIPARINDWLERTYPGFVLPFHLVFKDELQTEADRKKVMEYISWGPRELKNGLADPGTGLIHCYPEFFWQQLWRVGLQFIVLFFLSCIIFLWIPAAIKSVTFTHINSDGNALYLFAWLALLAGVCIHIAVDRSKSRHKTDGSALLPVSVWLKYLSSRTAKIIFNLFIALFVFVGLLYAVGLDKITIAQAFLAGYSLDSIVGLFSTSLEARTAEQASELRKIILPERVETA